MALTYGEISAITEKYFIPKLVDNIFTSNVLLQRARKKFMQTQDGGERIMCPVMYATTSASDWYSGADTLDITANDQITSAEFEWKQAYANITITRLDDLKNSGKLATVNFVKSKVQVAEKTLADKIGTGLYNLGTDADAIVGLRLAIDSTGTYGGIDRSTYTWWASQEDSSTTALSLSAMQALYGDCTIGNDKPSVIVTTQDIFDDYFALLQPQQRFQDSNTANAGFNNLLFRGVPIVVDNKCPASHMFMLNEDYLKLYIHTKENFRFEPFQKPLNQNVSSAKIYFAGALTSSNCRMQGKMNALV